MEMTDEQDCPFCTYTHTRSKYKKAAARLFDIMRNDHFLVMTDKGPMLLVSKVKEMECSSTHEWYYYCYLVDSRMLRYMFELTCSTRMLDEQAMDIITQPGVVVSSKNLTLAGFYDKEAAHS